MSTTDTSCPYRLASVALASTEKPAILAARLAEKAAILAALTDENVRDIFQNGGFCCNEFQKEFPDGCRAPTKCTHCGHDNELAVCPEPGCDAVDVRKLFNCWGGTCLNCDMMGQGTCVLCRASAPWWKLAGRKYGRRRIKAPLCRACVDAHPDLLPYTCNLPLVVEEELNKRDDKPWEKRRRLIAAATAAATADK